MSNLSARDRELVAIGAALASNCVPCIEFHIPEARKAGLTDEEIRQAVRQADKLRQVPAAKVLKTAMDFLGNETAEKAQTAGGSCCGAESKT